MPNNNLNPYFVEPVPTEATNGAIDFVIGNDKGWGHSLFVRGKIDQNEPCPPNSDPSVCPRGLVIDTFPTGSQEFTISFENIPAGEHTANVDFYSNDTMTEYLAHIETSFTSPT